MKTALITTTINKPEVLALYRAHDPDVMFFVAGDLKTPPEAEEFCRQLGNCVYIGANQNYAHAVHIGHNTDSKRNFALLEAMRWGADIIVSVDDDMIPLENRFWFDAVSPFQNPYNGFKLGMAGHWFSHGSLTKPGARERGIPFDYPIMSRPGFVTNAQIGAVQGIILGTPDTDAANAIVNQPIITGVTDVLRNGFAADQDCKCVFNSQLTAFRAELAPAFAQFYFAQKRNTDILASLLMRRIMREKNWYTYYGRPMGWHAREARPLFNDLKAEMYGLEKINEYADYLNRAPLPKDISVTESCRILAQGWNGPELEAAMAFYADCEQVLA
jgi:hypothetical protein